MLSAYLSDWIRIFVFVFDSLDLKHVVDAVKIASYTHLILEKPTCTKSNQHFSGGGTRSFLNITLINTGDESKASQNVIVR